MLIFNHIKRFAKLKYRAYLLGMALSLILAIPSYGQEHARVKNDSTTLFAIKTNLLYNLATVANLELELPIGNKLSIAGEYIFPWWVWDNGKSDSKRNRIQATIATLDLKYWFKNNNDNQKLTGWFAGVYGTYGAFDLEYQKDGIQSKNVISAGVTAGYTHTINKSGTLRMEYSLNAGYAQFDYKEYTAEFDGQVWNWDAFRDYTKRFQWYGPTRAKISLVWMIHNNGRRNEYE